MKLSIVVPCHNEEKTLAELLERVLAVSLEAEREVLIVDDGSTDRSVAIAEDFAARHPETVRTLRLERNQGKGAAVRAGFAEATGDVVLIQDADLEYDPADHPAIVAPFADPEVAVVYGSRIQGSRNFSYHAYYWGGRLVTLFTNLLYGCRISDEPTGYKAFRREVIRSIELESTGFEFCPEITAKVLRKGYVIHEAPIRYEPRSFAEGKKIRWWDGVLALWTLLRYRWS